MAAPQTSNIYPAHTKNPSFTQIDVTKIEKKNRLVLKNLNIFAFELELNNLYQSNIWTKLDTKRVLGFDLKKSVPKSPLALHSTSFHFGYYLGVDNSLQKLLRDIYNLFLPILDIYVFPKLKEWTVCTFLYLTKKD